MIDTNKRVFEFGADCRFRQEITGERREAFIGKYGWPFTPVRDDTPEFFVGATSLEEATKALIGTDEDPAISTAVDELRSKTAPALAPVTPAQIDLVILDARGLLGESESV